MAKKKFKNIDSDVLFIPALSREELMPKGSLQYIINKFVDGLNLEELEKSYSDEGCRSYPPRALLKAVLMSYCENVYGCRPIADKIKFDMRYGYMCGYLQPSFNTINRFRSQHLGLEGVESIFKQLVYQLSSENLVDIEDIYIDGTTIEARASRKRIVWCKAQRNRAGKNKQKINELIEQVRRAQHEDEDDNNDNNDKNNGLDTDAPEESGSGSSSHLSPDETAALKEVVATLPDSKTKKELAERLEKADRYRHEDDMCGERSGTATSDPDSIAMCPKDDVAHKGPRRPMYNAMAASSNQFLVHLGLYGLATDTAAFPYFFSELYSTFGDSLKAQTADAAFGNEVNVLLCEKYGFVPYFKHTMYDKEHKHRYKADPFQPQNFQNNDDGTLSCPAGRIFRKSGETTTIKHGIDQTQTHYICESCYGCLLKKQCRKGSQKGQREISINHRWWKDTKPRLDKRLDSQLGQNKLHRRAYNIEPCFAQVKWAGNYKRFRHFGAKRCLMDLNIKAIAVNLKKYANKARKGALYIDFFVEIWLRYPFLGYMKT